MNICIAGAGYVGLTTAAVLAELGHRVYCADRDESRVNRLNAGIMPIYEPGLEAVVQRNAEAGRLTFSHDVQACVRDSDYVMIAVGTPSATDGSADLTYVRSVLLTVAGAMNGHKTIIMKSTVPPGTGDWADAFLGGRGVEPHLYDIVSNPEFLREGTALHDSFHPDRIVIGAADDQAAQRVLALYNGIESEVFLTGRTEAEMIKYGSNAFLAVKLSYINELARACEAFQADITMVAAGIGLDSRIGSRYLQAGIGYGGSCLPKDVHALLGSSAARGVDMSLLRAVVEVNDTQPDVYIGKLAQLIGPLTPAAHIAVWGATFKENTDDIRYSQAMALMERLARLGCQVSAYDPLVSPPRPGIVWHKTALDAVRGADALILATGWQTFVDCDLAEVSARMRGDIVLDGRNRLDRDKVEQAGLRYAGIGRPDKH